MVVGVSAATILAEEEEEEEEGLTQMTDHRKLQLFHRFVTRTKRRLRKQVFKKKHRIIQIFAVNFILVVVLCAKML